MVNADRVKLPRALVQDAKELRSGINGICFDVNAIHTAIEEELERKKDKELERKKG